MHRVHRIGQPHRRDDSPSRGTREYSRRPRESILVAPRRSAKARPPRIRDRKGEAELLRRGPVRGNPLKAHHRRAVALKFNARTVLFRTLNQARARAFIAAPPLARSSGADHSSCPENETTFVISTPHWNYSERSPLAITVTIVPLTGSVKTHSSLPGTGIRSTSIAPP